MPYREHYNTVPRYEWCRRLDVDRVCDVVSPEETCSLCGDGTARNRVMNALAFELTDTRPGALHLPYTPTVKADSEDTCFTTAREASFPYVVAFMWPPLHPGGGRDMRNPRLPYCGPTIIPVRIGLMSSPRAHQRLRLLNISGSANCDLLYYRDSDAVIFNEINFQRHQRMLKNELYM